MLIEKIDSPQKLKQLTTDELKVLAKEIRKFLIQTLSITGGHLGPNLGVVELTLALHYVFESPSDKMIWDVGHQTYIHKIITGRKERFSTLRQYKGLCGFPKMSESEHDVWETGHSSTSLSAAMGMAIARDLKGENHKVIAVIGDGALTGGMALEALNHIGHEQKDLIVVLNDNEMSISPNVGALHNHLSKLRTHRHYRKAKEELDHLLHKVPAVGGTLAKTFERIKDSMKYLLLSGILFEELGYTYLGPIDGHDIEQLMESLRHADKTNGPVLVHVITKKGKGYKPAEQDVNALHGVGAYKIESGEELKKSTTPSYPELFAQILSRLAERDSRIIAVTPAMLSGSGLTAFAEKFSDRCIDVGIAEQHAVTMCGGLAAQGLKPVCAIYSTFLQRGYDQVIHDICRQKLNVCFAVDRAGLVGGDGETHQGVFDIAFLRTIPNMIVMMPKDENEFQHMLYTSIQLDIGPSAVRYPRGNGLGVVMDEEFHALPIGKAEVVQEGQEVALFALGPMVALAEKAADLLREKGMEPMVINARFVKPLDEELLFSLARKEYAIITLEEGALQGGMGSAVLECLACEGYHHVMVKNFGVPDYFVEHGSVGELREEIGLTAEHVAKEALALRPKKRQRV